MGIPTFHNNKMSMHHWTLGIIAIESQYPWIPPMETQWNQHGIDRLKHDEKVTFNKCNDSKTARLVVGLSSSLEVMNVIRHSISLCHPHCTGWSIRIVDAWLTTNPRIRLYTWVVFHWLNCHPYNWLVEYNHSNGSSFHSRNLSSPQKMTLYTPWKIYSSLWKLGNLPKAIKLIFKLHWSFQKQTVTFRLWFWSPTVDAPSPWSSPARRRWVCQGDVAKQQLYGCFDIHTKKHYTYLWL